MSNQFIKKQQSNGIDKKQHHHDSQKMNIDLNNESLYSGRAVTDFSR